MTYLGERACVTSEPWMTLNNVYTLASRRSNIYFETRIPDFSEPLILRRPDSSTMAVLRRIEQVFCTSSLMTMRILGEKDAHDSRI